MSNDAASRFIASMTMTFDMWHDGVGYDLDALRRVPPDERPGLEAALLSRQPPDWRDIEALAVLDTPRARRAVQAALHHPDPAVRRTASSCTEETVTDLERETLILQSLQDARMGESLSPVLDEIEEFHTPRIIQALLKSTLEREGGIAVHCAAMLFFLYGKANEPFDWNHRPLYLRFNTTDRAERLSAFRELCALIGVDPDSIQ